MAETRSSRALDALLDESGDDARKVRELVKERTTLWRYRKGKTIPSADVASDLDRVTSGRVPADGWSLTDLQETEPTGDAA